MSFTTAIVVAAGRSERFGGAVPKALVPWRGRPLLATTLDALDRCAAVHSVILVASEAVEDGWREAGAPGQKVHSVVRGGATRQASVAAGLGAASVESGIILVHDGARAFVEPGLIAKVVEAAVRSGAALPVLAISDTVKRLSRDGGRGFVVETLDRESLGLAQTPQAFRAAVLRAAHARAVERGWSATDDVALVEAAIADGSVPADVRIEAVPGEANNVKVTHPSDLPRRATGRVGLGQDVHPLVAGRAFMLAGVDLWAGAAPGTPTFGPVGHSDGDALSHALCDALLSAAALGDIGTHFPDTAAENEGRSSLEFVASVARLVRERGYSIVNVSAVLHLERPKIAPHARVVREALAQALGISADAVGLSAKRGEGLGDVGTGRAVCCDVVALLELS